MTTLNQTSWIVSIGQSGDQNATGSTGGFVVDALPSTAPLNTVLVWTSTGQPYRYNSLGQWVRLLPLSLWELNGEIVQMASTVDGISSAQHLMTTSDNSSGIATMSIQPRTTTDLSVGWGASRDASGIWKAARTGTAWAFVDNGTKFAVQYGAATLGSTVTMQDAIAVSSAGVVTIASVSTGALTVTSLTCTNNATVGGTLGVTGTSTLGAVNSGNHAVTGTLSASGLSTLTGGVTTPANLTTTGTGQLVVAGNASVGGTLGVSGAATLNGLGVANNATVGGTLGVTGTSTMGAVNSGNHAITGTLSTSGAATLNSMAVTNNATVGGTLGVTGAATFGALNTGNLAITGTLGTSGAATLNSLAVTNNASVGGQLSIGPSSFQLKYDATNGIQIYDLANGGLWLYQGGTTSKAVRTVNNVLDDGSGNAAIAGTLAVTGNQTNSGNIVLAGVVQAGAGLETTGDHATVTNNSNPIVRVVRPSGGALTMAIAAASSAYSNSAVAGDSVFRTESANNLFVQTGTGAEAIKIDSSNNVAVRNNATVGGTLGVTGLATLLAAGSSSTYHTVGNARTGDVNANSGFVVANSATYNATDYGFRQESSGKTMVNAKAGFDVSLRVNNSAVLTAQSTGVSVSGTLGSSGTATLNALTCTNNATVGGTLAVAYSLSCGSVSSADILAKTSVQLVSVGAPSGCVFGMQNTTTSNYGGLAKLGGSGTYFTGGNTDDVLLYCNSANRIAIGAWGQTSITLSAPTMIITPASSAVSINGTLTVGTDNTAGDSRTLLSSNGQLDFSYGPFTSTAYPAAASARIKCTDNSYSGDLAFLARQSGSDNATMNTNVTIAGATGNLATRGSITCPSLTCSGALTAGSFSPTTLSCSGNITSGSTVYTQYLNVAQIAYFLTQAQFSAGVSVTGSSSFSSTTFNNAITVYAPLSANTAAITLGDQVSSTQLAIVPNSKAGSTTTGAITYDIVGTTGLHYFWDNLEVSGHAVQTWRRLLDRFLGRAHQAGRRTFCRRSGAGQRHQTDHLQVQRRGRNRRRRQGTHRRGGPGDPSAVPLHGRIQEGQDRRGGDGRAYRGPQRPGIRAY